MSYSLRSDCQIGAAVLTFAGEVTAAELWRSRTDLTAVLGESGWKRVLVDFEHAVPRVFTEEVFDFVAGHADVFPRGTRIAVVVPEGRLSELADFSVTVAKNRGFGMQAFGETAAAITWLIG